MTNQTNLSSNESPTAVACDVDTRYYPHLFLIPAAIILTILSFLRRRKSFKKDVWGGRPGLVIPVDFLGIDHDRLATMFVFGAATGSILSLVLAGVIEGSNAWGKAFLIVGIAIEIALIYYPYFACLTSYHRIVGAMMGLPYSVIYFCVVLASAFQKCKNNTASGHWLIFLSTLPILICYVFIIGKFILVLYREIKEYGIFGVQLFSRDVESSSSQMKLVRPWLKNHVKNIFQPRPPPQYSRTEFYLRKIYNPEKDFKFSTETLSVMMICGILLYSFFIKGLYLISMALENLNFSIPWVLDLVRGMFGSLLAAVFLTTIICTLSLVRFMENHKNNMLRMFRGDKSFIPKNISASQFMVGRGLRFHSFQIGYFLWGLIFDLITLFLLCFVLFLLQYRFVWKIIHHFVGESSIMAGVAFFIWMCTLIASVTIFRDYNYSRNVISINNRNLYLVFSYFWFFVGLPLGLFSAIFRILKTMAVGLLMLPRIDHSIMPDGFQRIDPGYNAYICYLHVQAAFRNPVLRVFCQMLIDDHETLGASTVPRRGFIRLHDSVKR
ncbi:stimulated by retinoic acid gene 6 protein-like isoform X3 [Dendronephthya gigantea]|nr:stimulated by retinoic acid gene 6 protein-like isoform X3 [Dendronephthya gigantea]XP_028414105.1 stimulated by retinoic acid gene 6 protein-like isoform X3 [Dendronephthya gigantea]XP_028414106.1 stimulated by retinoic acid gene 6 protein-like isoform X3 [Dendronephthya gigantea]